MVPTLAYRVALAALLLVVSGCSLVSLKTPEKPLSTRDLNARILTHDFSARFIVAVEQTADEITATTDDPLVRLNALRWKIAASAASLRAASQMAPMLSLLDTWALTVQMNEYLTTGNGKSVFAVQQPRALTTAAALAGEAEDLTRRMTESGEFEKDQRFVTGYVQTHPIESLDFARASIAEAWTRDNSTKVKLVDSLGTVPEAMAEARDILRMYGDTTPSQILWRAQLVAQESGISSKDVQAALRQLDRRLAGLSTLADTTPGLVNGVVRDVRRQMDVSWVQMIQTIHSEGAALSAAVSAERQAAMDAVDVERAAMTTDAARIANQVVADAGNEARRLVREALLLAIVLAIVVLGLPFTAGYLVGRARRGA